MSVVISTNSAATIAANNLAYSSARLQNSLNRLSSGSKIVSPADDAGGLAVSMKLTAVSSRQSGLQSNLGDAASYAQTQDGALSVAGSILNRISELATLYNDPTKNTSDLANYDDEFSQLQSELTAIGGQTFNGISLFGSASLTVDTTDDLSAAGAVTVAQQDLLGSTSSPAFPALTEDWADLDNWWVASAAGSPITQAAGGHLNLFASGGSITANSIPSFSGPFQLTTDLTFNQTADLDIKYGGTVLADFQSSNFSGTRSVKISVDALGNSSVSIDGTLDPTRSLTGIDTSSPQALALEMSTTTGGGTLIGGLTMESTDATAPNNIGSIATASSLSGLSLSTITGAIQDVATMRAQNGAEQSRINFASTLLTTNQTNLQSAISNISDVDVAVETTNLAKWNVLVQAGTSMLTQANQSAQIALKLIAG